MASTTRRSARRTSASHSDIRVSPTRGLRLITKVATGGYRRVGRPRHAAASRAVGRRPPRDGRLRSLPRVVEAAATRTRIVEPARGVARRSIPLTAIYADQPRNGVRSLADTAVVILRAPRVPVATRRRSRNIGLNTNTGSDGTSHLVATVYADTAYLFMGRLDLTGVSRVTAELRSPAQYPFTSSCAMAHRPARSSAAPKSGGDATAVVHADDSDHRERREGGVSRAQDVRAGIGQFNNLVTIDGLSLSGAPRAVTQ
jgi:hypothetical protein